MKQCTGRGYAPIDVLTIEICTLGTLIGTAPTTATQEELRHERMELIAHVNGMPGTGHVLPYSSIAAANGATTKDGIRISIVE